VETSQPMPADHRASQGARQVIRRLLRRPCCACAACDMVEPEARRLAGMPIAHPEWFTRALPDADERYLTGLAGELWTGDDEYMDIIVEDRLRRARDDDGGQAGCTA
jgi:hypothetical protein